MARITASLYTSHIPAVGAAFDLGKTKEDYWKPVFAGYDFDKQWMKTHKPDVIVAVYNDHATAFSLAIYLIVTGVALSEATGTAVNGRRANTRRRDKGIRWWGLVRSGRCLPEPLKVRRCCGVALQRRLQQIGHRRGRLRQSRRRREPGSPGKEQTGRACRRPIGCRERPQRRQGARHPRRPPHLGSCQSQPPSGSKPAHGFSRAAAAR